MESIKKCPCCGEEIAVTAKKCKHCKEWLEQETTAVEPSGAIASESQGGMLAWIPILCYAAMFVAIICFVHDLNNSEIDLSGGRRGKAALFSLFCKVILFIPEWVAILADSTLWAILFWNIGSYFKQRGFKSTELFVALVGLEAVLGVSNLLMLKDGVDDFLIYFGLFILSAYIIVMFITGIKFKDEKGWIYLVYSIGMIISYLVYLSFSDIEGYYLAWIFIVDMSLKMFVLDRLRVQFEAINKQIENE